MKHSQFVVAVSVVASRAPGFLGYAVPFLDAWIRLAKQPEALEAP